MRVGAFILFNKNKPKSPLEDHRY